MLHEVRSDAEEYLIIGDEAALPAATGLPSALPAGITVTALLEIPADDDRRDLGSGRMGVT